ncbi:MAG: RNA polymerase subunit sigma-70 [Archangiaceae bacterium]|nr:RNA polymerase subunit sigma-70 [Archangiaceae bacterium]
MPELSQAAFVALVEGQRNALRLHCYRMLGSSHDSDDVVQETVARAWKNRGTLHDDAAARSWLYRIATNVCLDELHRRKVRRWPVGTVPPVGADAVDLTHPGDLDAWLEPCPDTWLDGIVASAEAAYSQKQSVALAFVVALQKLNPQQRAILLLRDVVGFSAEETAQALELSVSAANSALFRARTEMKQSPRESDPVDPGLLERYLRAWEQGDVAAFVSMLHDEVKTTMPPLPFWLEGLDSHRAFYRPMFRPERRVGLKLLPLRANGGPAFGFYRAAAPGEPSTPRAVHLLELEGSRITGIHHFVVPSLFPLFGLREQF